jgi:sec-independent protein translocase protein TatA
VPERDVQECVDEGHRRRNEHDDVVIVSAIEDALNPGGIWRAGIRQYRQGRHRRQQEQQRERTEQLRQSHLGPSLRPKRATVSTGNIPPGWIGSRLKEAGCMRANDPAREGPPAMIGSQDLVVGLVIVLVLFGAKKLPELAGSLGKSMKEFKKGVSEATEEEPAKPLTSDLRHAGNGSRNARKIART